MGISKELGLTLQLKASPNTLSPLSCLPTPQIQPAPSPEGEEERYQRLMLMICKVYANRPRLPESTWTVAGVSGELGVHTPGREIALLLAHLTPPTSSCDTQPPLPNPHPECWRPAHTNSTQWGGCRVAVMGWVQPLTSRSSQ